MFGYILINPKTLSKFEKTRYRSAYCGLCERLGKYGNVGRSVLSYDMTFVALLLHSVYALDESPGCERCAAKPFIRHPYITSDAFSYAADINILLAYYNDVDDWLDDRDSRALSRSKKLEKFLPDIAARLPRQVERIKKCIARLTEMERQNILNPDEPANCFGSLMGEIFCWREDTEAIAVPEAENNDGAVPKPNDCAVQKPTDGTVLKPTDGTVHKPTVDAVQMPAVDVAGLRRMGEALGRYVYILDASNDLHDDIQKERYNPLISQSETDFEPLLTMLIGECTKEFENLNPQRDIHLLRNILYSGVWMKYRLKRHKKELTNG